MKIFRLFIFLVYFPLTFVKASDHLGLMVTERAIQNLVDSALTGLDKDQAGNKVLEIAKIDQTIPLLDLKNQLDPKDFSQLHNFIDNHYPHLLKKPISLFIHARSLKVLSQLKPEDVKVNIEQIHDYKYKLDFAVKIRNFRVTLNQLNFCSEKNCPQKANFIKFKDIEMGVNKNLDFKISTHLNIDERALTSAHNSSFKSQVLSLDIVNLQHNLQPGSGLKLRPLKYKGSTGNNSKYPEISRNMILSQDWGYSVTPSDLRNELNANKDLIFESVLSEITKYLGNDLIKDLNSLIKKNAYQKSALGGSLRLNDVRTDNSLLASLKKVIDRIDYGILLNRFYNPASQAYAMTFNPELSFDGKFVIPHNKIGRDKFSKTLQPLIFREFSKGGQVSLALSESYINSLLHFVHSEDILNHVLRDNSNILGAGVTLAKEGVKIHLKDNKLFAIVNLQLNLDEMDDLKRYEKWIANFVLKRFGYHNGEVFLPLEFELTLSVLEKNGESALVVNGLSPVLTDGSLANTFNYPSTVDDVRKFILLPSPGPVPVTLVKIPDMLDPLAFINRKIITSIKEKLADNFELKGRASREVLKEITLDQKELLGNVPLDFKLLNIQFTNTGHIIINTEIFGIKKGN